MKAWLIILSLFTLAPSLWGKSFSTDYIEFQLPPGWQCALEGAEWVCQSQNKERKREAIIILAAKEKGAQDGLNQYESYLGQKKSFTLPNGKKQISESKYTKRIKIHGDIWIDSLHLASEVPGFYTRYMATIKGDLGMAVTFSVSKEHYDSYRKVFQKVIESMRAIAVLRGQLSKTLGIKKKLQDLLSSDQDLEFFATPEVGGSSQLKKKEDDGGMFFIGIILAVAGFIYYKRKKRKK